MAELKTSITDIPIANDRIYTEMSKGLKIPVSEIETIINFMGTYTANIIRQGAMESVMIPYFGKFKPKVNSLRAMKLRQQNEANGKDMVYRALKGVNMADFRLEELKTPTVSVPKLPEDEDI